MQAVSVRFQEDPMDGVMNYLCYRGETSEGIRNQQDIRAGKILARNSRWPRAGKTLARNNFLCACSVWLGRFGWREYLRERELWIWDANVLGKSWRVCWMAKKCFWSYKSFWGCFTFFFLEVFLGQYVCTAVVLGFVHATDRKNVNIYRRLS
jgi:hypothetical protein